MQARHDIYWHILSAQGLLHIGVAELDKCEKITDAININIQKMLLYDSKSVGFDIYGQLKDKNTV